MDFALKSVDELFPTPLFRFEIKNAAELNRALLKEIAQRRAAEEGLKKSNRNGWHSDADLFERKEPAQAALAQILLRIIAKSTRSFAPDADFNNIELLADGWVNVNPNSHVPSPDGHPMCLTGTHDALVGGVRPALILLLGALGFLLLIAMLGVIVLSKRFEGLDDIK